MELFAVIYSMGGYCRGDATIPKLAGIYTDLKVAEKVRSCVSGSTIQKVKLDEIAPGYVDFAKNVLGVDILKLQEKNKAQFVPMSDFALKCRMTVEEFQECEDGGGIISGDGVGNWATETEESNVSCFSPKPEWATHVCWYNN